MTGLIFIFPLLDAAVASCCSLLDGACGVCLCRMCADVVKDAALLLAAFFSGCGIANVQLL